MKKILYNGPTHSQSSSWISDWRNLDELLKKFPNSELVKGETIFAGNDHGYNSRIEDFYCWMVGDVVVIYRGTKPAPGGESGYLSQPTAEIIIAGDEAKCLSLEKRLGLLGSGMKAQDQQAQGD